MHREQPEQRDGAHRRSGLAHRCDPKRLVVARCSGPPGSPLGGAGLSEGTPWRTRIDKAVRDRLAPEVPDGWLKLANAARVLGVARQTVLHKVQRGELEAVHVNQ
jgi:hypothetical protein